MARRRKTSTKRKGNYRYKKVRVRGKDRKMHTVYKLRKRK